MTELHGAYNSAKVFSNTLADSARVQLQAICDLAFLSDCKIRVMPDVHAGKGCTIGTTMTLHGKVVPNMVGVDIGCGMETAVLAERDLDLEVLDQVIRTRIPAGMEIRQTPHPLSGQAELAKLRCVRATNGHRALHSIGTLGGGNHFIEVDRDSAGTLYLIVHSGSRHFGCEVAEYFQEEGNRTLSGNGRLQIQELVASLKAQGRFQEIETSVQEAKRLQRQTKIPSELAYVEGELFKDYLHDMRITQQFAKLNRQAILDEIVQGMGLTVQETFSTIHNYIDTEAMILRKGAVSARAGERLLIPMNMRDGSLLCVGRGNEDWNCSAPHGAGRLMSRNAASRQFTLEAFQEVMQGIYTTSVGLDTLDECPMAYKDMGEVIAQLGPTADIIAHLVPIYNFKAGGGFQPAPEIKY